MTVHFFPGRSAAASYKATGATVVSWHAPFVWSDVLDPSARATWLRERTWLRHLDPAEWSEEEDAAALETLARADEVVVWTGVHLEEQAFLVCAVNALLRVGVTLDRIAVREVEPGTESSTTLGTLLVRDLERVATAARSLAPADLELLRDTWAALTANDPTSLFALLPRLDERLPHLASRLRLAAWRYPSAASGLNLWEARLLANAAAHGPTAARVVAQTMSDGWEAEDLGMAFPYVDLEYFAALIRLAGGPAPLLTLDEDPDASLGAARVELTDAGRRVLEGRANALACVGPGAWVFNVPVSPSPGRAWVRDPFGSIVEHVIR